MRGIFLFLFALVNTSTEAGFLTGAFAKLKTISYYAAWQGTNANSISPCGYDFAWFEITYYADTPRTAKYGMNKQTSDLVFICTKGNKDVYEMTPRVSNSACHYILFEKDSDGKINKNAVIHEYYFNGNIGLVTICYMENNGGTSGGSYSGGSVNPNSGEGSYNNNSKSRSSGRRTCPGCNGSGKGADQITYSPNYTDNSRYCSTCGKTTFAHTHHRPMCRTCYGKGYVE